MSDTICHHSHTGHSPHPRASTLPNFQPFQDATLGTNNKVQDDDDDDGDGKFAVVEFLFIMTVTVSP